MAKLFENFELNRTPRWPHLARTLAASVFVHAALFAVVAYVPTVRSMLHIAGMFGGAEYVDEDYSRIDIRERAVMLKLDGPQEKLYYPAGYFNNYAGQPTAAPAPEMIGAEVVQEARNVPPPQPKRRTPEPTPTPLPTPSPEQEEVAANEGSATGEPVAGETPAEAVQPKTDEELDKLAADTKTKRFPKINSKPFKDLLAKGKEMMDAGVIDLKGDISMTIEADRNADGTLANVEVTKVSTTDEDLKTLALEFVQALSASRALSALEGTTHLTMEVESNTAQVSATVTTKMESEAMAKEKALGYNGMLFFGGFTKRGKDEEEIFKSTQISAKDNEITLKFAMTREAAAKLLDKQIPKATPAS